ncbi:pyrroline-5-carboxylate reductase, partial [Campylobacter jejuni]|nr:pyrroline-5-carboxylate reductase [Campylobacter jejuni]
HPAIIKENICSPGGVTIKGIKITRTKRNSRKFFEAINASSAK